MVAVPFYMDWSGPREVRRIGTAGTRRSPGLAVEFAAGPTLYRRMWIFDLGGIQWPHLLTGEDTNGSVSVFEVMVPAGQNLAATAHKNDAFEETLYGIQAW